MDGVERVVVLEVLYASGEFSLYWICLLGWLADMIGWMGALLDVGM